MSTIVCMRHCSILPLFCVEALDFFYCAENFYDHFDQLLLFYWWFLCSDVE